MKLPEFISSEEFSYTLPESRIARFPMPERNMSKLLVYKQGIIGEDRFNNIVKHLPENHLLVFNNTRVIHARLEFFKDTGARIEIFCLEPVTPSDYASSISSKNQCIWKCLTGNLKKLKGSILIKSLNILEQQCELHAKIIEINADTQIVRFDWNADVTFGEILEVSGEIPIPPYLERKSVPDDSIRYQTVYSKIKGSVAAPTAGLHFTQDEFEKFGQANIQTDFVTLHVGAGTFVPLKTENILHHKMHAEHFMIRLSLIENLLKFYPKIIAVGTTTVRTLESLISLARIIEKHENTDYITINQFDAYGLNSSNNTTFALNIIKEYMQKHGLTTLNASTSIMIIPGYNFRLIKGLITNFHQPGSTLLTLVSALIGNDWKKVYNYALENEFRFLSYGDSSLLIP
jgi:S-adenosylmethionine:tRNA ribosyltransferase-isomerase